MACSIWCPEGQIFYRNISLGRPTEEHTGRAPRPWPGAGRSRARCASTWPLRRATRTSMHPARRAPARCAPVCGHFVTAAPRPRAPPGLRRGPSGAGRRRRGHAPCCAAAPRRRTGGRAAAARAGHAADDDECLCALCVCLVACTHSTLWPAQYRGGAARRGRGHGCLLSCSTPHPARQGSGACGSFLLFCASSDSPPFDLTFSLLFLFFFWSVIGTSLAFFFLLFFSPSFFFLFFCFVFDSHPFLGLLILDKQDVAVAAGCAAHAARWPGGRRGEAEAGGVYIQQDPAARRRSPQCRCKTTTTRKKEEKKEREREREKGKEQRKENGVTFFLSSLPFSLPCYCCCRCLFLKQICCCVLSLSFRLLFFLLFSPSFFFFFSISSFPVVVVFCLCAKGI